MENSSIFNFKFNKIKIEEFLFIKKKYHDKIGGLKDCQIEMIKENLVRIDEMDTNSLYEICQNDKLYFHCFMLLIYNFKRFFVQKEGKQEKIKLNRYKLIRIFSVI